MLAGPQRAAPAAQRRGRPRAGQGRRGPGRWQRVVLPSACPPRRRRCAPLEPQDRGAQPWARHRDEAAAPATGRRDAPAVAASALAPRLHRRGALRLAPWHRQQERRPRRRRLAAARSAGERDAAPCAHVQHMPLRVAAGLRLAGCRAAAAHAHRRGCQGRAATTAHKRGGEWCAECCWWWCRRLRQHERSRACWRRGGHRQ